MPFRDFEHQDLQRGDLPRQDVSRRRALQTLIALPLALAGASLSGFASAQAPQKNRLVIQVSDGDPKKWALALNNAKNVQQDLGKDKVDIEIVAYGPGIGMLRMDSEVSGRVTEAMKDGVQIVACENTMTNQKIPKDDMLPKISYVKAGVTEIMAKQQQGWSYIRP